MKLSEFIYKNSIFIDVQADSQKNVFKILGNTFSKKNKDLSSLIIEKLNERERLGSTSVGNGIAIPHTKVDGIKETQVIFLKLKSGVDFSAPDGKKIDLIFSIIAPENSESDHLLILSSISNFIKKKEKVDRLRGAATIDEIQFLFSKI
ncbi:MAG: transcriptional regulator [Rickettsiales bacterium]|nr:transcriptional regulator [Rickettsiales bacterium]RPG14844.1 MAG: transcriptional regulator [Pelagibacteraceae bacterium TMED195]|tara:strand:- start:945 stop:1391 length:447 start_codon:yes stop_codon:yes gene_type:complete